MKMEKRKFRIGELAEHLGVERFVIRFWEKEFGVRARRSDGGQRFYDERDLKKFILIKELLYDKGFTIAGAKKFIKVSGKKAIDEKIIASQVTSMESDITITPASKKEDDAHPNNLSSHLTEQILELQRKLLKLRELL